MTLKELIDSLNFPPGTTDAAVADALNSPTETEQRPRVLAESELMGLVTPQTVATVVRDSLFPLFKKDVKENNAGGVALWAGLFLALGVIDQAAADAITTYAAGTVGVAVSPGVKNGFGRVTVDMVEDARRLA